MKKIFTLIAMALMAVGANAQEEYDVPLDAAAWGWGWNSTVSVDEGVMTIQLTGNYGAASTGFDPVRDCSNYDKLCVVIESYNGGWGQIIMKCDDGTVDDNGNKKGKEFTQGIGTVTSTKTFTLDFSKVSSDLTSKVFQISIQGGTDNPTIKVSRVYFVQKLNYKEGKNVEFNEDGFIPAANLASYSDAAKVEFTMTAAGPALSNYWGWGIGKFESAGTGVQVGDFALKNEGDNVYTYSIKDLRPAFEGDANANGDKGINWVIWGQGTGDGNTFTRKSIVAYEVEGAPTAISAVNTNNNANAVRYNLAGQKVDAGYKGLVIMNGRKAVIK